VQEVQVDDLFAVLESSMTRAGADDASLAAEPARSYRRKTVVYLLGEGVLTPDDRPWGERAVIRTDPPGTTTVTRGPAGADLGTMVKALLAMAESSPDAPSEVEAEDGSFRVVKSKVPVDHTHWEVVFRWEEPRQGGYDAVILNSFGECTFRLGGYLSRADGPAQLTYQEGKSHKTWFFYGLCHNLDGPANVTEDADGNLVPTLLKDIATYFVGGTGVGEALWQELRAMAQRGTPLPELPVWATVLGDRSVARKLVNGRAVTQKGDCAATVRKMAKTGVPPDYVKRLQGTGAGNSDITKLYLQGVPLEQAVERFRSSWKGALAGLPSAARSPVT
jgi:hypothetical protein